MMECVTRAEFYGSIVVIFAFLFVFSLRIRSLRSFVKDLTSSIEDNSLKIKNILSSRAKRRQFTK